MSARTRELADTVTLALEPVDDQGPFAFAPGQFNMLYLFGRGEVPISISGDPDAGLPLLHTIRTRGSVTSGFADLEPGAMVGLRGPFGSPWPLDACANRHVLLIAGGLGLAPLRAAAYALAKPGSRAARVTLLYGARTPGDILFHAELDRWRADARLDMRMTVDSAGPDWTGSVGTVTRLIEQCEFDPENTIAFLCGPEIMMHFAVGALADRALAPERMFLSLERNMKCAIGHCGHCQFGPHFICRQGPVLRYDRLAGIFKLAEI